MDFQKRLNKLMRAHGFANNDVGKAVGVSGSTIHRWRHGETWPRVDEAQRLAEAFGLTLAEFVGGEEELTPDERQLLRTIRALGLDFDEAIRRLSRPEPTRLEASYEDEGNGKNAGQRGGRGRA